MRFGCEMSKFQRQCKIAWITYTNEMDDKLLGLHLLWPSYHIKPDDEVDEINSK